MSYKKTLLIVGLATIFISLSLGTLAYAGGGTDPPSFCQTVGEPTIWGVVTMDCTQDVVTARVKKIDNCEVKTFSLTHGRYIANCPENDTDPIDNGFPVVPFGPVTNDQGVPAAGVIITKAKNFKLDVVELYDEDGNPFTSNSISFDAQFKYCYPSP